jgi:hypothetical protein
MKTVHTQKKKRLGIKLIFSPKLHRNKETGWESNQFSPQNWSHMSFNRSFRLALPLYLYSWLIFFINSSLVRIKSYKSVDLIQLHSRLWLLSNCGWNRDEIRLNSNWGCYRPKDRVILQITLPLFYTYQVWSMDIKVYYRSLLFYQH